MPIDASIPLSYKFPQFQSPGERQRQMQMQEAQRNSEAMRAFQAERANLGPNASDEDMANLAFRHIRDPKDLGTLLERKQAHKQLPETQRARLLQTYQQFDANMAIRLNAARNDNERLALERQRAQAKQAFDEASLRQTGARLFYDTGIDVPTPVLAPPVAQGAPATTAQPMGVAAQAPTEEAGLAMARGLSAQGTPFRIGVGWTPETPAAQAPQAAAPAIRPVQTGPRPLSPKMQDQARLALEKTRSDDTAAATNIESNLSRMSTLAADLKTHPCLSRATGLMSWAPLYGGLATVPGSDPANFKASLESLKSQVGFAVLQAMREASKTGGALGQVSDFENRMLQSNLAALDTAQDPAEIRKALDKIVLYSKDAKTRIGNAMRLKYGNTQTSAQPASGGIKFLGFE